MIDIARSAIRNTQGVRQAINSNMACRVTTVAGNGHYANVEGYTNSEIRELSIMLPYGISSSALEGMGVQVILNSCNNGTIVGVMDNGRPRVKPGEVILYSSSGSRIEMLSDGKIKLVPGNGGAPLIVG